MCDDAERSERKYSSTSVDSVEHDRLLTAERQQVGMATPDDTVCRRSAHTVVHDILGYHKLCAMWMRTILTAEHGLIIGSSRALP